MDFGAALVIPADRDFFKFVMAAPGDVNNLSIKAPIKDFILSTKKDWPKSLLSNLDDDLSKIYLVEFLDPKKKVIDDIWV